MIVTMTLSKDAPFSKMSCPGRPSEICERGESVKIPAILVQGKKLPPYWTCSNPEILHKENPEANTTEPLAGASKETSQPEAKDDSPKKAKTQTKADKEKDH